MRRKWFWDVEIQRFRRVSNKEVGSPKPGDFVFLDGECLPVPAGDKRPPSTANVAHQ